MRAGRNRKRTIKAARQIPVEQIVEFLRPHEDMVDDHFLVYESGLDAWFICCWSRTNGMMTTTIEDDVLDLACVEYMKSHGYLMFDSMEQASAHIKDRGWTCSRSWPGKQA
jgi:hypothetical protein